MDDSSVAGLGEMLSIYDVLVSSIPNPAIMLDLCGRLDSGYGRSSERLVNAMHAVSPAEFDKPEPNEGFVIDLSKGDKYCPVDTGDVGRMLHKLTIFPDTFMERLRALMERGNTRTQSAYGNLISNFPYALYLCLFQTIFDSEEAKKVVRCARQGNAGCRRILNVPGLIDHLNDWDCITRDWSADVVNSETPNDNVDDLIRLTGARDVSRFDVRNAFSNDHLNSFLAVKIKVLLDKRNIGPAWLSFSGQGKRCGGDIAPLSRSKISKWQYEDYEPEPFDTADADAQIRLNFVLLSGSPSSTAKIPSTFTVRDLKAFVENQLRNKGSEPREFALYFGFPSSKIEASDDTTINALNLHQQVVTVRDL